MFNQVFLSEGSGRFFWSCTTPEQALALGRALAAQGGRRSVLLAREQGPQATLLSLGAVTGLMAGGGTAQDYGVRTRGEFRFLREQDCPITLFFRERPQPGVELSLFCEETRHADLLAQLLEAVGEWAGSVQPQPPGQWLRRRGGREDYFHKLVSLGTPDLAGSCWRFRGPDREAQTLGNQALSVLGVRAAGGGLLVLDSLGRLTGLCRAGQPALEWPQLRPLLEGADARRLGKAPQGAGWSLPWLEDGLMAGILLIALLQSQAEPDRQQPQLQLALPMLQWIAPQDHT